MNFSEISSDVRQGVRPEGTPSPKAAGRPPARDPGTRDTPNTHDQNGTAESGRPLTREETTALAANMQKTLDANNVKLKFNILEEDDTVQVEILNGEGKTIRKIPSDDMIKLSKSLENLDRGFLDARF
jgi:flagellar protein FlaG